MSQPPLRFRLPNAPADFTGRQSEARTLADALRDAVVSVVYGPEGVGKTSLVLYVIHHVLTRKVDRCLFISVSNEQSGDEIKQDMIRALAEAEGQSIAWGGLQSDPQAMTDVLLEMAEAGKWWIVLDELHHATVRVASDLLSELSRYARQSRFIVTMRPAPDLIDGSYRLINLKGLSQEELEKLARAWGHTNPTEAVLEGVARSGGSPWLLRQHLTTGRSGAEITQDFLLQDLSPLAQRLLYLGVNIGETLPRATWLRIAGAGAEPALAETESRGFWESGAGGLRLHEMVKDVLKRGPAAPESRADLHAAATVLCQEDEVLSVLEGVRLLLLLGEMESACATLEAKLARILAAGYAARLWRMIPPVHDKRLDVVRLRCAAELGNPTVLSKVLEPPEEDPNETLTWAETLYMRGRLDEAMDAFQKLATPSEPTPLHADLFVRSCVGWVRCLLAEGKPDEALARLADWSSQHTPKILAFDGLTAAAQIARAKDPEALESALHGTAELLPRLVELPEDLRDDVVFEMALACSDAGAVNHARELLAFSHVRLSQSPDLFVVRRALCLGAAVAVQAGQLDVAERNIDLLDPFIRSRSLLLPDFLAVKALLQIAKVQMDGLGTLLNQIDTESGALEAGRARARLSDLCVHMDLISAVQSATAGARHPLARIAEMFSDDTGIANGTLSRELGVILQWAQRYGNWLLEAEVRSLLCDVWVLQRNRSQLVSETNGLAKIAMETGSERFAQETRFFTAVSTPAVDAAAIEQLAREPGSLRVNRRCQLILGAGQRDSGLDTRVAATVRSWTGFSPTTLTLKDVSTTGVILTGWGIDIDQNRVWLANGNWIDFSRRPQHFSVLDVLCRLGGRASKEDLVTLAWGEKEYHPLRHDTRLQVAIRKLRELIEEDPSKPMRIVTTPQGYRLGGAIRVVRTQDNLEKASQ